MSDPVQENSLSADFDAMLSANEIKIETEATGEENEESTGEEQSEGGEVSTEEEVKEEVQDSAKDTEISELKKDIAELKELLKTKGGNAEEEQAPVEEVNRVTIENLISNEEFDRAFEDKKVFASLLQRAVELGRTEILKTLPNLISSMVAQTVNNTSAVETFQKENKDIFEYGIKDADPDKRTKIERRIRLIASIASDMEARNPNLTKGQILKLTAQEVRDTLNIPKGKPAPAVKPKNPGFVDAPSSKSQSTQPEVTGTAKEIQDMLSALM